MEGNELEKVVGVEAQADVPAVIDNNGAMLTDRFVENAEKQIDLRRKLLTAGLRACRQHDFQDFDNKPYLEGEGAARIMAVVRGFKVSEAQFKVENITPHYFVECQIPMEFMGATTVAIGDCSTADPFFTGRDGKGGQFKRHLERTASEVMAARLMLGDAKKKARENAISRGVSELLGIKGLTWEDLEALGFKRSGAGASVKFKSGSNGAEAKTLSIPEAVNAAKGSIINVRGLLVDAKERQVKKKDGSATTVTDYTLQDEETHLVEMSITAWGSCIEGISKDDAIYCEGVTVGEYQGKPSYLAKMIQKVEVA